MNSFKESLKYHLLNYPHLYNGSTWDICCQFFTTVGNGMVWSNDGELMGAYYCQKNPVMDYSELEDDATKIKKDIEKYGSDEYHQYLLLRNRAIYAQRKFIEENIDLLTSKISGNPLFGDNVIKLNRYEKPDTVCYSHAKFFNYPENINNDWSKAMYEFGEQWLKILYVEYGSQALELIEKIKAVMLDLRCKFTQKTVEELVEQDKKMQDDILSEYFKLREMQKNEFIN